MPHTVTQPQPVADKSNRYARSAKNPKVAVLLVVMTLKKLGQTFRNTFPAIHTATTLQTTHAIAIADRCSNKDNRYSTDSLAVITTVG